MISQVNCSGCRKPIEGNAPSSTEGLRSGIVHCEDCFLEQSEALLETHRSELIRLKWPLLRRGSRYEMERLSNLRKLPFSGLEWASEKGFLRFGIVCAHAVWAVIDDSRVVAQVRRCDGRRWSSSIKALTLSGSVASWPLGAADIEHQRVFICEGSPDFLSACALASELKNVSPVCLLGSRQRIHASALKFFRGKTVTIFGHNDVAGQEGALNWGDQLLRNGCGSVDLFDFEPLGVKDLNESLISHGLDKTAEAIKGAM